MRCDMKASFSVDVEKDLHTGSYNGITKGIPELLKLLERNKIKATFFVTGETLEKYPKITKLLAKKGHEIGLHGYSHKRFDSMSLKDKENEIKLSIKAYKKILKNKPKGFRAPQHSIDSETIRILDKYNFRYDSSIASRNIMLLRHLLKRKSNKIEIIRNFFGKMSPYKISKNLIEIPRASPLLALGGFELKVYPSFLIKAIINLHILLNIPLNFVMHSWDMIDTPGSRTSRYCTGKEFEARLDKFIKEIKKKTKIVKVSELIR